MGNNIKAIAQATGGDVYNAISASDLTYQSGGVVHIPEQFIGEGSDGDGIPDIVELYGLKTNGEPMNTNPYSRDTDGDGIDDNVELGYIPGILTSSATIADYVKALKPHSDPTSEDTDGDGLEDDVEQLIGTKLTVSDTDSDDLSDGLKIELWYDPFDDNPDGDSYNDYEEYCGGTDPYTYDKTGWELTGDFIEGFLLGDFTGSESIPMLLGQITSGFVPVAADVRDLIANAGKGEWGYALLSVAGIIPIGGDIAKVVGSLGEFIAKNIDDAPMIVKAINEVSTQFPDIAKHLPASTFDDIVASLKNGQTLTKSEYLKLKEVFEAGGRNLDELLGNGCLVLKGQNYSESYVTRLRETFALFHNKGYQIGEHGLNRMLCRIDQGKIQSVDEVMDILETGVKYADTEKGGIVLFKNNISIHIADNGFIKTIVGNANVKSTWELIE